MYIYQQRDWPHFTWNEEEILPYLLSLRYQQGILSGKMQTQDFHLRQEDLIENLTKEVIKTSKIEGEILDYQQVRSSVAHHLGFKRKGKWNQEVEGIVEIVIDATNHFHLPLTKERICRWHHSLFPSKSLKQMIIGKWRTQGVQIISGAIGKEKVHFEGPKAETIEKEMALLLQWIEKENSIDFIIKAAIAHLWFVTIHPFDDGNGRIGRAIAELLLARSEGTIYRFYSLSAQIEKERKGYYAILEKSTKGTLEITPWITWFLQCLIHAVEEAQNRVDLSLYKKRFWKSVAEIELNERQKKVLSLLLDEFHGKLTSSKWAKIAKCSQDSAYRDIVDLIDKKILIKSEAKGRSTSYLLRPLL